MHMMKPDKFIVVNTTAEALEVELNKLFAEDAQVLQVIYNTGLNPVGAAPMMIVAQKVIKIAPPGFAGKDGGSNGQ